MRLSRPFAVATFVLSAILSVALLPAAAAHARVPAVSAVATATLERGDHGKAVRRLQERLAELRYFVGEADGDYGYVTEQAVLAFQKVNGLARDGIAGPQTRRALDQPTRPVARTTASRAIEVIIERQVVMLVRHGRVRRIFNASTGTSATPTPTGRFRTYREIGGWHISALGPMYRPKYFHEGYALHGSSSVPAFAASHGCVRLNVASADFLWSRVPLGTRVAIYDHMDE